MDNYGKITALYSRLSVGDEDRDGGESNSIVNQKAFLERYARQQKLTNIRHYIDDDESGRFFDRSAYVRMMEDVEKGLIQKIVVYRLDRLSRSIADFGRLWDILERHGVEYKCYCSRQRVKNALISMGPQELRSLIAEQGRAELTCQFCDAVYRFEREELEELLRGEKPEN